MLGFVRVNHSDSGKQRRDLPDVANIAGYIMKEEDSVLDSQVVFILILLVGVALSIVV